MLFKYEGITDSGEKITGSFWGTKQELIFFLRQKKIFLTSIIEEKKKLKKGKYNILQFSNDIEQLSYMISAGVKLDKAIQSLIKNSTKKAQIEFWEYIQNSLRSGKQFSSALKEASKKYNLNLNNFYINIISIGEEVGDLSSAINKVLSHLQFRNKVLNEIKSALAYPVFLIFVSIIAIFFITYIILPRFSSIFSINELNKLPLVSKYVIKIGININQNSHFIFVLIGIIVVAILLFWDNIKKISSLLHKLPVIKELYFNLELANLFSSLGTMIAAGVEISKAIKLSEDIVNVKTLKNLIRETGNELKKGIKISEVWQRYTDIIPEEVNSLIIAGESSARLEDAFISLSDRYSERFKQNISKMLSLLEPVIIIILGFFIGIVVIAIMLAVVSLSNVAV